MSWSCICAGWRSCAGRCCARPRGITEEQARWRPDGKLLPLLGLVNHLTNVEWRWIDGEMLGEPTGKTEDEYTPGPELTIEAASPPIARAAARPTPRSVGSRPDHSGPARATARTCASSSCT